MYIWSLFKYRKMSTANSGNVEREHENVEEDSSNEEFQVVDEWVADDDTIQSPMISDGKYFYWKFLIGVYVIS